MKRLWLFGGIVCLFILTGTVYASDPTVVFFSPQGEVKNIRQVTARFSDQMVQFGDPRLVEPFDIQCAEKGRGRWADSRNWVYDFERDLPAGVVCEFTVKSNLVTVAEKKIGGVQKFSFSTGGPAIKRSNPWEGNSIDEEQVFLLALDAEAKESSVLDHAYCSVEGINERIGVKIIKGDERELLLKSQGQYYHFGLSRDGTKDIPVTLLQCKQNFPS